LGKLVHREGVALNHLLASACFILWANPSNLFHLGFQLSFVAVASILLFEPLFTSWLSWNSWIGKKLGAAMGVSTAAQLGTAPLGLFYFQSFPLLFLPANLIAVPLSSLLLLLYLLLLPLHPFLSQNTRIILIDQPIHFFLKIMSIFESLPISIWQHSITWEQACLFFAGIVQFRISVIFPTRWNWAVLSFLLILGMLWPNLKN
jgi:competence protein ComEC